MCKEGFFRTLFVSDLDGTLLNKDQVLSAYTQKTLNFLISEGVLFTYATARSFTTAREVTKGLDTRLPVIVYNGAFIVDAESRQTVMARHFADAEKEEILALFLAHKVYPRVYALHDGVEAFSYEEEHLSQGTRAYLAKRLGDKRARPTSIDRLIDGDVFCFSAIDDHEKLLPLYERVKEKYHAVLYRDPYTNDFWLEVLPKLATKASAVMALKEFYQADRVVVFGDEKNDLSMFSVADACYAVENANSEVKQMANDVIASNDSDGVAKFLLFHYEECCNTK